MIMKTVIPKVLFVFSLLILSCNNEYYPKPKGFFRIELPEKTYVRFDSLPMPYSFEIPEYAQIVPDTGQNAEPYWIDIHYNLFKASLHFSYKSVDNNLDIFLEDARLFVNKHIPKASMINERLYNNPLSKVHGIVFSIEGSGAASPIQFFLTDSTHHFVRAALYFNYTPNNDSLAPVINYLKEDIEHMVETFKWRY